MHFLESRYLPTIDVSTRSVNRFPIVAVAPGRCFGSTDFDALGLFLKRESCRLCGAFF